MYLSPRAAIDAAKVFQGKVSLRKERLNREGYTRDGVYFGLPVVPLYFVQDEEGIYYNWLRASCREEAIEKARDIYPLAKIRK